MLRPLVRLAARWTFSPSAEWPAIRHRVDWTTAHSPIPSGVAVSPRVLGGVAADLHTPRGARSDAIILYLHGGGYATGSRTSHRALVARLAHACNVSAYVLAYRLAPEHPCPAAFEDVVSAYRALLDDGWAGSQILVVGDSAGAALTLMLAIGARDELNLPLPAAVGLICPPIEHDVAALATRTNAATDPILTVGLIRRFFDAYTHESADTSSLQLLQRSLHGLPPMVVEASGRDLLLDDARDLARRAQKANVRVHYTEHPGQGHVFHVMAGLTWAANRAVDNIACQLTTELDRHEYLTSPTGIPE
ncbi:alpha/beta hydrolase fold domain-containing protein [Mycobacteroides chelonae]|uniref:alpha/beta hydrolase fold domain-containing protein n=1 Tax=Mycobacteroides chelonae TaxID=1774 RepID=UPI0007B44CF4|nr:alpha/beta hydrolase fold domain-containing protein [Mycobacteroides chelonae]ANB00575.1 alpha/beta hydrolase [Mycobacteroides chelonae CCUG 47445]